MQAVAILLVASTMGGDFPTNPNAYHSLPPVLRSAQPTKGRSLLDQAMQATADTAAETANSAGNSLRRNANALRRNATAARNGIRRTAGELSLSGPTGTVAQAQYQQRNGLLRRPVEGTVGPGNRSAGTDPTQYRGAGRLQPVPPAGYDPTATATPPPATTRNTGAATYRPPAMTSGTNSANTTNGYTGLELPPLLPAEKPTLPPRNYGNTAATPSYPGASAQPRTPIANPGLTATPSSSYRPPTNTDPYGTKPTEPYGTNVADPYAKRTATDIFNARKTPGTVISPADGRNLTNVNDRIGEGIANANHRIGNGLEAAGDTLDNEIQRAGGSYFMTLLALFASVGLNLYLGWIAWDTYNRYQDLVSDMRTTGSRRERRPERRRFTETSAAAY